MAQTIIGLNDPKAVKRFSAFLAVDTARVSYFNKKFMGVGPESGMPIQLLPQLESDAGEQITFDLSMQLRQQPIEGDDVQEGTEEDLKFYTDNVYIDQMRGGVNSGGRMTRKRTIHDLRRVARARQAEWWGRVFDELFYMYISGSRGGNTEYIFPLSYTGFSNNAFATPDAEHHMFGGDAASFVTISNNDQITTLEIDRAVTKAVMMGGGTQGTPQIQPVMIDGEEHYVLLMSPWQAFDLRTSTGASNWLEIQKAAITAEGRNNPIFKGGLGMHNSVVLHSHKGVIRFIDAGAGADQPAARALFMGSQAAVTAFGSPGTGLRFNWHEETRDNGNQLVISTSSIFGVKKTRFTIEGTAKDFGVIALDTYSADPG
jgi:N4-gp56 family major capsid protein